MNKNREKKLKKNTKKEKVSPLAVKQKEKYLQAFFLAFIAFAIVILPLTIYTGGYFIYYGDFNSQQMPFYYHAHEMVTNGDFFWDWGTDLGANFIGSYSFYLLFSPFFWLTFFLKKQFLMYAMPVLLCLKYATASLTAYVYIRKFVKNTDCALIGALLYAFSGFQSYNVFFNHFHDVTAFFPLLLCAMEDRINKDRRGIFVLAVAFMASLNYFFFTGQVAFGLIYLILRCSADDFKINAKKYGAIIIEAILGGMIACAVLLPSALAIMDNTRIDDGLYGLDLVAYDDRTRIWRIIQSFFMIPDAPARPNLFDSDNAKWASIAGYLPLFSMAGVITFINKKRGHWASKTIIICIICAFIPILNSMFYMFNGSYYARWFYMPILIMAMMTASTLEEQGMDMKHGLKICTYFLIAFGVISLLPTYEDDKVQWFSFADNTIYFYITLAVSVICLLYSYRIAGLKNNKRPYIKHALIATVTACFMCTATVVYFGVSIGPYPKEYINHTFKAEEFDLTIPAEPSAETEIVKNTDNAETEITEEPVISDNNFWRVDVSEDYDNYPMFWGYSSMRTFHSIVPASIMNFYSEIGITRDVASRASAESYTLRGLFSVKYYFNYNDGTDGSTESDIKGFEYLKSQNGFDIYENKYFVPMGFTYDYFITTSQAEKLETADRERVLMRAIVLDDKYVLENGDNLGVKQIVDTTMNEETYYEECQNRTASACYSFENDTKGFTAKTNLENENLVFFSVPYDKGWTATVNGVETEIVEANYGFMAVKGEVGENIIKFSYTPYGLKAGVIISCAGILLFIAYLVVAGIMAKKASEMPAPYFKESELDDGSAEDKENKKAREKIKKQSIKRKAEDAKKSAKTEKQKVRNRKKKNDDFEEETQSTPEEKHITEENQEEIERFMKGYTSVINVKKSAEDFKNSKLFEDINNTDDENNEEE